MNYPPAPWQLRGNAIQTLNLVDIDRVRQFVPPELDIVAVLPGKTLGSIYISEYQIGSVLTYNELIVAPALFMSIILIR
jgi:acetoacetate decarboxylase